MISKIIPALLTFFSAIVLYVPLLNAQDRCGTMEHLQMQLQQAPGLSARMQAIEQQTQQFLTNPANLSQRAIITIPVVVHIVYANSTQNISDAQVLSQIAQLNLDYRKQNTDWTNTPTVWQSLVADYQIEFCLASRDPNNNPTTGIVRKSTTVSSFSTNDNVKRNSSGGDNAWPAASYLNIWVCNLGGGILGYAQFPGGAAATDGVVINYTAFGTMGTARAPYNKGRTATHEIGHWLNLYHIWGDDNGSCSGSDNVNDTPNQASEHYGCPSFPSVSCNNGPNGDMFMNYMDYSDDACLYMFTNGQYARSSALFATNGSRYSLLSSQGCVPFTQAPVANFTADHTTSCTGTVRFTDLTSGGSSSWLWDFGDGNSSTQQNPVHTYANNGTFTVTLIATNQYGTDTARQTDYITIARPNAPIATGASRCGSGTVTLSAASSDTLKWYASHSATTPLGVGNTFTTPTISATTTYYVEGTTARSSYHVGKTDNSGGGSNLNSSWYLIFDVMQPCTLESVYVYAQGSGNRTFELRDNADNVLATKTVNVPNGGSRVSLNFSLSTGTGYQIGLPSGSTINLYRNNFTTNYYPYTDAGGYVSITGNTVPNNYYYYLYDWIITGASCTSERTPVTATVNPALHLATPSVTPPNCNGAANGIISIAATGGTPAYSYIWNNNQSTAAIANLSAGIYTVTANDSKGCSATATATVTEPAAITLHAEATPVRCFGENDGAVQLNVSGGSPTYEYLWSNGNDSAYLTNLTAGSYTVSVTDAHACSATVAVAIPSPAAISPTITTTDATCMSNDGSAQVTATGGVGPLLYTWSDGSHTPSLSNLNAGAYTVTVTDSLQCSATAVAAISNAGAITATTSATPTTCYNDSTGSVHVQVSSGAAPITYLWSTGAQSATLHSLPAGTYTVTVSDANGCSAIFSPVVSQPLPIYVTVSTSPTGCGANTGTAMATANGGTGGYNYDWNNTGNTANMQQLAAGSYTVTVTDANGCSSSATGIVNSAGNLQVSSNALPVSCSGGINGIGTISVNNGTAPFTYTWSNGDTGATAANLSAGAYTVTITDALNCQSIQSLIITEPTPLQLVVTTTVPSCSGNNGSATITTTGGTPGYSYSWSTGSDSSAITHLGEGSYTVTVEDAAHCQDTASFTLLVPSPVVLSISATNNICYGDNSGTASVTASGGDPSYSYYWSTGNTNNQISGLTAGTYAVTVTDADQCTASASATVNPAPQIQFTTTTTDAVSGQNNGSISLSNLSGGTPPYSFVWNNGAVGNTVNGLAAGTYSVTVTDGNGCSQSAQISVNETTGLGEVIPAIIFSVHPNPASQNITITMGNPTEGTIILLQNILGQTVVQQKTQGTHTTIDVSLLPGSIYWVKVQAAGRQGIKQLVIAH